MYRYHLTASFEKRESVIEATTCLENSTVTLSIPFVSPTGSFRYGLQKTVDELKKFDIYPSETGFDAIIFGILVYMADMKISRAKQAQDSWTREIILTIPVSDDRWHQYKATFERMLKFLTGDIWEIHFSKRDTLQAETVKQDMRNNKYQYASLFSGGMDSLIAAINFMEQQQPTLLISHAGESVVRHWQTDLLSVLDEEYSSVPHDNAYYWTNLDNVEFPAAEFDMNQRSRSFLFIAIALFAMSGTSNCKHLYMPENGLIAINVPLDCLRLGSHSTRTTHPFYLTLWNGIIAELFGYTISNPYWNKTKGEMALECRNKELLKIALRQSFSCSSVNSAKIRSGKAQHCGHCLPCIIRRAAIYKAFGSDDPSEYLFPQVHELIENRESVGEQIRSFQYAIDKVKKYPNSKYTLIHKPGPLNGNDDYLAEMADTYYRGLLEVDAWIQGRLGEEQC